MSTFTYSFFVARGWITLLSLEKQLLFLLSSTESIDVKTLVEIYEKRSVDHQIIRNALMRLKKDGYAVSPERSRYSIAPLGLDFLTEINRKPRLLDRSWDGHWLSVLFEVPETERKKRDAFRNDLLQLGFGGLYKSVYISPWDYSEEAIRFAGYHGLADRVTLSMGSFVHGAPSPGQAKRLWRLDELNETYKLQLDWLRSELLPSIEAQTGIRDDGLSLFVGFLELGERMADLNLRDPMLPEELLEEDWLGRTCLGEMQASLTRIAGLIPESSPYRVFVSRFLTPNSIVSDPVR